MSAKTVFLHALRIAWKDTRQLFRNHLRLVLMIIMPTFMMAMIGFIYPSGNAPTISNLPVGLVNQDIGYNNITLPSQALISALQHFNNQTNMLEFSNVTSFDDIKTGIQDAKIEGGIIIPNNFSTCIMSSEQGMLIIITDQSNPTISSELQSSLTLAFDKMGTVLAEEKVQSLSSKVTANNSLAIVKPYLVEIQGVVSGNPSYFSFIAPGMIMMTVMSSVMTGLPGAISQEKEVGTMDGMMVAPISRFSIILGKAMSQTARGLFQAIIIMLLALGLFGVFIHGSVLLVFALMLLGVYSFVGLGIVLTSIAKDQETATMLMMTITFPMLFLSGVFFPIQQMPWFMQDISKILPLTYAADAMRRVMVLGAGVSAISTDIIVLVIFGSIMLAIAVPLFRRMMSR